MKLKCLQQWQVVLEKHIQLGAARRSRGETATLVGCELWHVLGEGLYGKLSYHCCAHLVGDWRVVCRILCPRRISRSQIVIEQGERVYGPWYLLRLILQLNDRSSIDYWHYSRQLSQHCQPNYRLWSSNILLIDWHTEAHYAPNISVEPLSTISTHHWRLRNSAADRCNPPPWLKRSISNEHPPCSNRWCCAAIPPRRGV